MTGFLIETLTQSSSIVRPIVLLAGACIYLAMQYLHSRRANPKGLPLPPGPPRPIPWIGNAFELTDHKPWLQFDELTKQYGKSRIVKRNSTKAELCHRRRCLSEVLRPRNGRSWVP
jgi:hypothetical protein